jgi:hypothetical protein
MLVHKEIDMPMQAMRVEEAIRACIECQRLCDQCAVEGIVAGTKESASATRLCLDCATLCGACVTLLSRRSDFEASICRLCANICDACAAECERVRSEAMLRCADACRTCADACREVL